MYKIRKTLIKNFLPQVNKNTHNNNNIRKIFLVFSFHRYLKSDKNEENVKFLNE